MHWHSRSWARGDRWPYYLLLQPEAFLEFDLESCNLMLLLLTKSVHYVALSSIPLAVSLVDEKDFIFNFILHAVTKVDGQLRIYSTEIKIKFPLLTSCWKSRESTICCTQSWLITTLIYCEFLKVGLWAKTFMSWWNTLYIMEDLSTAAFLLKLFFIVKGCFRKWEGLVSKLSMLYWLYCTLWCSCNARMGVH